MLVCPQRRRSVVHRSTCIDHPPRERRSASTEQPGSLLGPVDPRHLPRLKHWLRSCVAQQPGVAVSAAILEGKPNLGTVLRSLAEQDHREVTLLPMWFTLSAEASEDLERNYRRAQELRPELTLRIAPPLGTVLDPFQAAKQAAPTADSLPMFSIPDGPSDERRMLKSPEISHLVLSCTCASCVGAGAWEMSQRLATELQQSGLCGSRSVDEGSTWPS
jgi:CbiX